MNKNIPKVQFRVASLEKTFPLIHSFLNPNKNEPNWSDAIYGHYPELKNKLQGIKNKKARRIAEYKYLESIFIKEKHKLEKSRESFQCQWDKINNEIMLALSEVIEQNWPEKDKRIIARVTLNPIYPRFPKERMFDIFYKQKAEYMKSVAIHEIFHFLYFEKWKDIFPKTKEREFDSPYLVWQLSEMAPGIVLNDPKIQKVFEYKFRSYKEYENLEINGRSIMSYLKNFYDDKKDFEDFLKKSWKFVKEYKKEINTIWE